MGSKTVSTEPDSSTVKAKVIYQPTVRDGAVNRMKRPRTNHLLLQSEDLACDAGASGIEHWISVKDEMPGIGVAVRCQLKGCWSGKIVEYDLIHVQEDDCSWRTADDLSEVSYDFDVISWKPI